jgi:PAS domain S-box-containing protein
MGVGFYLIFIFRKKTENKTKKKQAKIILNTAIIAFLIGTVTDVVLLKSGIYKIPPVGDILVSIWAFGLAYSITKYEFLITPATAANNIISTMADSLILLNQKGNIVDVNKATLDLLGYEKSELTGKSARIFLVEKDPNGNLLERVIKEDIIDNYELILESKSGKNIPVIFSSSTLKDELGAVAGVVCTAHDITERNKRKEETRLLYDEIEKKNKELMKLDEMKSEFLSMVSHEIRTPLSIMKQFVSILSDSIPGKINKIQKEYLDIVNNNINHLALIVNDLLDISKLESGKMKLFQKTTDISSLIKNTIVSFETKAKTKKIDLIASLPGELPEVFLDSNRITQVLTNLISNALKFTPEKGKITVKAQVKGKFLEVSVTDTGPGIDPENLDKVFDRFEQLKQDSTRTAQGTGLGLSIVKKIIKMHGGKIWVESPPQAGPALRDFAELNKPKSSDKNGEGSRFIFILSLEQKEGSEK